MNRTQFIMYGLLAVLLVYMAGTTAFAGDAVASEPAVGISNKVISSTVGGVVSNAGTTTEMNTISVDPSYYYLMLQPGNSGNFTVTVTNKEDVAVTLHPTMVVTPYTYSYMDESWVTITPSELTIEAGQKAEFVVNVSIPKDAEIGNYATTLAFMENISEGDILYQGFPGTVQLNVDVWTPPQVQILTTYIYDRVETGKVYNYEIMLKNTGNSEITIDPKLVENMYYPMVAEKASVSTDSASSIPYYGGSGQAFGSDAITITGPSSIKPGETAVVKVKLEVPADAKGDFSGSIDLNIDDPGIREYEGMVSLNFHVAVQPEKPYEIPFKVNDNGTVTIELTSHMYDMYASSSSADPSFKVKLINPQGNEVEAVKAGVQYGGSVTVGSISYPVLMASGNTLEYQSYSQDYVETYTVQASAGQWTLSVMPHNIENFEYSIKIGPSQ
ncbi:hypothetical protein [uncultured Methanomethylovorans sp.]|uniref:COG1470 family protein n=1 Tax=uncultured Methanomethylovorans sp. TaxID=183759 RepID=UPI002AA8D6E0|nr:hypothetical protein [uncultured Methanomethylovorans sp.]